MAISMQVQNRTCTTKGQLRKLRAEGQVPAVVYGKQMSNPVVISVLEKELDMMMRTQPNAVIEFRNPAFDKQTVMVSEIQRDPISGKLLHADFQQINMSEEIRANIRIELSGDSVGAKAGGIQQLILHELEVQCLPGQIPDAIVADVTNLAIGESLMVSDLFLPESVEVKTDHDAVVVTILAPQKEEESITEENNQLQAEQEKQEV
ncbi:50S ribosomal protein L25 [Paenibacillus yanchengensis]|uniref:Large ribosomal subunit protein bL25 n=1 Tax=Paenibacillus yanchengensis TaxID=2035833 RepID=A0ABW4YJ57_9BACL